MRLSMGLDTKAELAVSSLEEKEEKKSGNM
jgi:hypothetical protein